MGKIEELINKIMLYDDSQIATFIKRGMVEDLQQLKSSLPIQQDKVVVKKYIADWYEKHKYDTLEAKFSRAQVDKDERVRKWYDNCQGRHANERANAQEVIAKMDLIGYTVEKEPLYYIELPLEGKTVRYCDQAYTEKQIKEIDKRYWAFAVPVEEESQ